MSTIKKQCNKCLNYYPATTEFFYKRAESVDGLRNDCKQCKISNTVKNHERRKQGED